jgi:hypothetical protein
MAKKSVKLDGAEIRVTGGRLGWIKTRMYWQRQPCAVFVLPQDC